MYSLLISIPFTVLILTLTYRIATYVHPLRAAGSAVLVCLAGTLLLLLPYFALLKGYPLGPFGVITTLCLSASWALVPAALGFGILGLLLWANARAIPRGGAPLIWLTALTYSVFRIGDMIQMDLLIRATNDTPREAKWTRFETSMPIVTKIADIAALFALITIIYLIGTAIYGRIKRRRNAL